MSTNNKFASVLNQINETKVYDTNNFNYNAIGVNTHKPVQEFYVQTDYSNELSNKPVINVNDINLPEVMKNQQVDALVQETDQVVENTKLMPMLQAEMSLSFAKRIKAIGTEYAVQTAVKYFLIHAKIMRDWSTIELALQDIKNNDVMRFQIYLEAISWPYNPSNEFSSWRYWDELCVLAYYQKDMKTACFAYNTLVKHAKYPEHHKQRILDNAKWYQNAAYDTTLQTMKTEIVSVVKQHSCVDFVPCTQVRSIVHFIYLKGYEFSMHHYIAVKSAIATMKWNTVLIWNDVAPINNYWWIMLEQIPNVHIINITVPKFCNRNEVKYAQHQADIIRLNVLYHLGGVYMDLDMLTLNNFSIVLQDLNEQQSICLCRETTERLSNAFIACIQQSKFIEKWIEQYESQYGSAAVDWWGGLSVVMPYKLSQTIPCKILDTCCFLPFDYTNTEFFKHNQSLLTTSLKFNGVYGIHLWDTEQQKRNILPKDLKEFQATNSIFYQMFKQYVQLEDSSLQSALVSSVANPCFIVTLEGNIGSGKSTLLNTIRNTSFDFKYVILPENIHEWTSFYDSNDMNILEHYYQEQHRYSYCFQSLALISNIKQLLQAVQQLQNERTIIICERSYMTGLYVFVETLYAQKLMTEIEYMTYKQCYDQLQLLINIPINMFVYLNADVTTCLQRIQSRNRKGEEQLENNYLQLLQDQHTKWLQHQNDVHVFQSNYEVDTTEYNEQFCKLVQAINQQAKQHFNL